MSDDDFYHLRDCVYSHSGIVFNNDSRYILEKRLFRRLAALDLQSFHEYYHFLKYDPKREQELKDIMDILTINETYFFRESPQFKVFTDEVIPEIITAKTAEGNKTLRIWSAGCSSGEEPYTIAMLLRGIPELNGWKREIVGTDISNRVLQQARLGVYGKSSFRVTDDAYIKRFFVEQGDGFRVCDEIRDMVSFSHFNLFDTDRMVMLGKMDLIFCRNVIIYFDSAAKKRVVESFATVLYDGGFLLLGHSESLMNITSRFTLHHFKNDVIYQKPERLTEVTP